MGVIDRLFSRPLPRNVTSGDPDVESILMFVIGGDSPAPSSRTKRWKNSSPRVLEMPGHARREGHQVVWDSGRWPGTEIEGRLPTVRVATTGVKTA
jgi:hypothetical protein